MAQSPLAKTGGATDVTSMVEDARPTCRLPRRADSAGAGLARHTLVVPSLESVMSWTVTVTDGSGAPIATSGAGCMAG